jgi:hypothetical protein
VLDAPYGGLTTLGRDGYPQSTMVAFLAEDGLVRISLNTTRQKTGNLMARPRGHLSKQRGSGARGRRQQAC